MTIIDPRIVYDTEFVENGRTIDLVSIGMVRMCDGATYYAVSSEFDQEKARTHPFVGREVWPHLPLTRIDVSTWDGPPEYVLKLDLDHFDVKSRKTIADEVRELVLGEGLPELAPGQVWEPQLWASYAAYDHVALCQLFGPMVELPKGFPMWTNDIKQESVRLGDPRWPGRGADQQNHHALGDARHGADVVRYLDGIASGMFSCF